MRKMKLFIPLTKVDAKERIVYGVATREELDKSEEIFDYESSKPLFQKWSDSINTASGGKSWGNVRAMHGKVAAGKLAEPLTFDDDDKNISVAAKIVDDGEWQKVEEGVYTGFSIGGRYAKVWKDATLGKNRYTADPAEISIVDNPCVTSASFTMIKADGTEEQVDFHPPELPVVDEAEKSASPANDKVAARATVLAKHFGEENEWPDYIEQARKDLTKGEAAPPSPSPAPAEAVVETQVTVTNEEVAKRATELAKAAGHEAKWPEYIVVARDELTKAKAKDAKKDGEDGDGKDAEDTADNTAEGGKDGKDKKDAKADKAFTPTPRNPEPGLEQVWKAKDGSTFATRKEAAAHNTKLAESDAQPDAAKALSAALGKADAALGKEAVIVPPADAPKDKAEAIVKLADIVGSVEGISILPSLRKFIVAKGTELGVKLPGRFTKLEFGDLRKSLYDVGRLASIIDDLKWYMQSVAWEEDAENDTASTTVADTKKAIADLCMILRDRVVEETQELFQGEEDPVIIELFELSHRPSGVDAIAKVFADAGLPMEKRAASISIMPLLAKVGAKHSMKDQATLNKAHDALAELGADCGGDAEKLAKAGARHSKADLAKIQQAHDNLVDVGAECGDGEEGDAEKTAPADLSKLDETELGKKLTKALADNDALTKAINAALPKIEQLTAEVEKIKAQPMPGGPARTDAVRVVSKVEDNEEVANANALLDEVRKTNPDAIATALIKLSQRQGANFQPATR